MEAVESYWAEVYDPPRWRTSYFDLPEAQRAPMNSDFANTDNESPFYHEAMDWVLARRILTDEILWVPLDCVSLDYTKDGNSRLDRSSNGLGAGRTATFAAMTALLEVIERDAFAAWTRKPPAVRTADRVSLRSIRFAWFLELVKRIEAAGLRLSLFRMPSVVGLPAFVCEIRELSGSRRRWLGSACRSRLYDALAQSVVEAAQSRLTVIAGARDDLSVTTWYSGATEPAYLAEPMPTHLAPMDWAELVSAHGDTEALDVTRLARLLAQAGFPQASLIDLSPADGDFAVVKAIVPGLARGARSRRTERLDK